MTSPTTHPTYMIVNLDALKQNVREVRRRVGNATKIIASVKANAYGHGIVPIARSLSSAGVEMLATGSFEDAVKIREAGISIPILMFGALLPSAIDDFSKFGLTPTIHNKETAQVITNGVKTTTSIFIKVDCGFGRLGIPIGEAHRFVTDIARQPNIQVIGLYTHLPFFDEAGYKWACERISKFDAFVKQLFDEGLTIPFTEARASAAIVSGIQDDCTSVSPGGILYGHSPVVEGLGDTSGFGSVLESLRTRLIHIAHGTNDSMSGGKGLYAARMEGLTGVVPFGRSDGNRTAATGESAHMLLNGKKLPILGVSLEHCILDLSAAKQAQVGDEVVILGSCNDAKITLAQMAAWWGAGINDVLMALNGRIRQKFLPDHVENKLERP